MLPLAILNCPIITNDGIYSYKTIGLTKAKDLVYHALTDYADGYAGIDSAVGHKATAEVLSKLLNTSVEFNRQEFHHQVGQTAIIFRLKQRAPEGSILSIEDLERIGFDLGLLGRIS